MAGFPDMSKNFSTKADAKQWSATMESKIRNNQILPELESKKHTFNELVTAYLDWVEARNPHQVEMKKSHLKNFTGEIGELTLAELRKKHISELLLKLGKKKKKNGKVIKQSTVARYFQTLTHCLKYGSNELEWMPGNPASNIQRPPESEPSERFLSYDELSVVLGQAKKMSKKFSGLIIILVSTGMRISEALKFRPVDVVDDYTAILVRKTKNKKTRRVAIFGPAREALIYWCKRTARNKPVFGGDDRNNYQKCWRMWNKLVKMARIEKITLHGLRHTLASYLAMSGSQLLEISRILGHSSTKMSERYAHLMDEFTQIKVKNISKGVITKALDVSRETNPGEKENV